MLQNFRSPLRNKWSNNRIADWTTSFCIHAQKPVILCFSSACKCDVCHRFIPESPRWLMAVGREKEALQILEGAARWNGREVTAIKELVQRLRPDQEALNCDKKATLADLMRTPNLRRNTLALFFSWFLAGLTFYGFSQSLSKVGGNIFVTTVLAGETENLVCSVIETRQY